MVLVTIRTMASVARHGEEDPRPWASTACVDAARVILHIDLDCFYAQVSFVTFLNTSKHTQQTHLNCLRTDFV